ncbi:MAG: GNAT family N-acetyltransferase [Chloroflexota bacterium]
MVITATAGQSVTEGIRPVDLGRDIPQVLDLLRLAFGESMDSDERKAFSEAAIRPDFLWRLDPAASRLGSGFVWVSNGRIVGNVTLLSTRAQGRFLVANVAVHPSFRRRGIAVALMRAVEDTVRSRRGQVILLQVVKENDPAIALYRQLGYRQVGNMTTWSATASRLRQIPASVNGNPVPEIRPLPGNLWRHAYDLDTIYVAPDLNWPEPLPKDAYQQTWLGRVRDFMSGRQREVWMTTGNLNQLNGLASITSEWGRPHVVALRFAAGTTDQLARPLLAKVVRRLAYLSRRNVRIEHPEDDTIVNDLLHEANFSAQRTLTHMRYDLL